jgi:hypothetical protein
MLLASGDRLGTALAHHGGDEVSEEAGDGEADPEPEVEGDQANYGEQDQPPVEPQERGDGRRDAGQEHEGVEAILHGFGAL